MEIFCRALPTLRLRVLISNQLTSGAGSDTNPPTVSPFSRSKPRERRYNAWMSHTVTVVLISLFSILSLTANAAGQPVSCDDYDKTVTPQESWLNCHVDDPAYEYSSHVAIVDLYVSPEIAGKRQTIAWYGQSGMDPVLNALDSAPEVSELLQATVSESLIQLNFTPASNDQSYAMISVNASRDTSKGLLDTNGFVAGKGDLDLIVPSHRFFGSGIKWGRDNAGMTCTIVAPAAFESSIYLNSLGCDDALTDENQIRNCQPYRLWKSIRQKTGMPIEAKNTMSFVQSADGKIHCEINL